MIRSDPETPAYMLFDTPIRNLCRNNWHFLEPDDRIAEAQFLFIVALRTYPTNSGHFWSDYKRALSEYMLQLKLIHGKQRCRISLDSPLRTKYDSGRKVTRLDLLRAPEPDNTHWLVHRFLSAASFRQRHVLELLMDGKSRRCVCRRLHMTMRELEELLHSIAEDYRDFCLQDESYHSF